MEWGATSGFKTPHELSMDDSLFYSVGNTCTKDSTQNLFYMTDDMVYIVFIAKSILKSALLASTLCTDGLLVDVFMFISCNSIEININTDE